jgi:hypothetical protein
LGSADGNGFLRELLKLDGGVSAIAARDLLNEFARHDDPWWLEVLRKQESTITEPLAAASLSLVLRRSPSFGSLWKRKGDLTAQELKVLNGALRSSEYAVHFEKARKELLKNGVLLTLHRFRPYSVPLGGDPAKDSVTLIRSGGSLTSVVLLSPLIRSLQTAWDEDLHVHAFGVTTGGITKAEVLGMLIPKHRAAKKSGMSQPSVRKKKRTRGSKRR